MALRQNLARELKAFVTPGPRLVDEGECVLSVLLAILFAHAIGAQNVYWAAFSGYVVMRGHVSQSLPRGLLRIAGTGLGAGLAWLLAPILLRSLAAVALGGALIGGLALYAALTRRRAYAWLFIGLTFEMILLDKLEHPGRALAAFAETRLLEVAAGTAACVLVSLVSTITVRRRWPAPPAPGPTSVGWHSAAARHAAQAAVALALLPLLWWLFAVPQLAQSAITIMAVMLVPLPSLGTSGMRPVSRRLLYRAAGCLVGAAVAAPILLVAGGSVPVLIAATVLGVALGRHIENGQGEIAYGGAQFTLAILLTLVPDSYADAAIGPALDRLIGILVGAALLEPVLLAFSLRNRRRKVPAPADAEVERVCETIRMTEEKKEAAPPRPATTVLLLRPSQPGDAGSPVEVFMVVRHHQIDSFSGALVFPGGKLEESDGDPKLRARCGGADKISAEELKFRIAGVREAFEECGVLLARKRGQRNVIAAADLKAIEQKWRAKLTKDEASIVDLVDAEDLELATDLMTPFAHWITPTFVPKRFDTWFFLAEAPQDQIALHDGSESVDSVWITPQVAIAEAKAGKRTLVHATTKNLELLADGKTVTGAISQATERKIVTVQPWLETREGRKFLHIPEGAGYRNLVREM